MNITKQDLDWAVSQGIISEAQAQILLRELSKRSSERSNFNFANVVYYFGGLIVLSALTIFMSLGWDQFHGLTIFGIAFLYAAGFAFLGRKLWRNENQKIPGGIMYTLAVCMTPLAIYGLQKWSGAWIGKAPEDYHAFFNWISSSWIAMEAGTVLAGLAVLHFVRFPFLLFPISFALWFLSIDIVTLFRENAEVDWDTRCWISLFFGIAMLIAATVINRKTKEDYAFWLYFFGMLSFYVGLYLLWDHGGEVGKFIFCLISVFIVLSAVALNRKVLLVFGGLGIFGYLSYLAYSIFNNSILFPFVLSLIGLGIIYAGLLYNRNAVKINEGLRRSLPGSISKRLPKD